MKPFKLAQILSIGFSFLLILIALPLDDWAQLSYKEGEAGQNVDVFQGLWKIKDGDEEAKEINLDDLPDQRCKDGLLGAVGSRRLTQHIAPTHPLLPILYIRECLHFLHSLEILLACIMRYKAKRSHKRRSPR